MHGVGFGTLAKGVMSATVAADKWHSDFTPSEQSALHSVKVNYVIKRFKLSLQIKRTFSFEYPVYAKKRYAINCRPTVFLHL